MPYDAEVAEGRDSWLSNRHTLAWGCIGIGLTLLIGTVPLARSLYPRSSPWWLAPGLILGAVLLLFGLIILVLPTSTVNVPTTELSPIPENPTLTVIDVEQGSSASSNASEFGQGINAITKTCMQLGDPYFAGSAVSFP
jgi:hypothetical protein